MNAEINGDLVTLAREYRGCTQDQVASEALIRQGTIAKIEGGLMPNVSDDVVSRIARALGFPLDFFYLDDERINFGSSSYYYRKKARVSAADRKFITGVVNIHRISLKKLLDSVDMEATRALPSFDLDDYEGDAREAARATRAAWSLPDGPIKNITRLMESAGVLIVPCDFKTNHMDATSIHVANCPPMVFINKGMPGDRWRFTLAHELGHLVLHDSPSETMEDEADEFAGEFLTPHDQVSSQLRRLGRVRVADLFDIKPYWKVSAASLLMRADEIGLLTSNQKRYLWAEFSKAGYKTSEPTPIPREEPTSHIGLIRYFIDQLAYTVEEIAKTISLSVDDFAHLYADCLPKPTTPVKLRLVK